MLKKIQKKFWLDIKNFPGWRSNRKLLTIECDDWGSIRMPSASVYQSLLNSGLNVNTGWFNRYDTLETREDLEYLFDTLQSVRDINGSPAILTAFCNVANPDFRKIRESGFKEYYYELFTDTLNRYYPGKNVFSLWEEGMKAGIFVPELHGREHLSVQHWLNYLPKRSDLMVAFDHDFTSLDLEGVPDVLKEFRAEFYFDNDIQKPFLKNSINAAVKLFIQVFGHEPRIFVPSNNIFHPDFDADLSSNGIQYLCVSNRMPYPYKGKLKHRYFISGQKGPGTLRYYTRNCAFEPSGHNYSDINQTMKQVEAAFRFGKPASISTHRVNFAGGIDAGNRDKGLSELKKLLKALVSRWPDLEFSSSLTALEYLKSKN